jgi:hypothetical protein
VVYPGRWDPVELCGDLLHPVVPSPIDYLELECKGRSERVMGSFGTRYSGTDSADNSCGGGGGVE